MRVEQRHPGVEVGLDFDFGLGLDLQMDGGVLRLLLRELRLVRGDGLIGLRPRLRASSFGSGGGIGGAGGGCSNCPVCGLMAEGSLKN
jgi:hypothetical protein